MHFGFALDFSDIDLWTIDLLDTHLDLLDRISPVKILFASETSWRHLQDMSSRRLEDVFSVNNFSSSRRLGRSKIVTLKTCWRRVEDQQMFAGMFPLFDMT